MKGHERERERESPNSRRSQRTREVLGLGAETELSASSHADGWSNPYLPRMCFHPYLHVCLCTCLPLYQNNGPVRPFPFDVHAFSLPIHFVIG